MSYGITASCLSFSFSLGPFYFLGPFHPFLKLVQVGLLGPGSVILEDFAKGHRSIEAWRFFAGERIVSVVTHQGLMKQKNKCIEIEIHENVTCWSNTVPLPQKKLYLAVLVTTPSLSWIGRQMWKIWGRKGVVFWSI